MAEYLLVATRGDQRSQHRFEADNDLQATVMGGLEVVQLAWTRSLWAKGRIELRGPDGAVLETMEEKS